MSFELVNLNSCNDEEFVNYQLYPNEFLLSQQHCKVFGLNLTIGWPLPENLKNEYEDLLQRITSIEDQDIYIYPFWQTHVTIITLVNFKNHKNPKVSLIQNLLRQKQEIIYNFETILKKIQIKAFYLDFQSPFLGKEAVIIPITNPSGEIKRIRIEVKELIEQKNTFFSEFIEINIPDIIHTTIMRFVKKPQNRSRYAEEFHLLTKNFSLGRAFINEIYLTSETKPYMREGNILHRYLL